MAEGKKGILSNWIVRNILLAAAVLVAVAVLTSILLDKATRHGKEITVPDFSGMSVGEAIMVAKSHGVRATVTDSVYIRRMARGAVYGQSPKAGSNVKRGRKIHLTINSVSPRKVQMPNLIGYSMRQAKAELLSRGLLLGRLIYVSDMATNNVLRQQRRGSPVKPGTHVDSGTEIDLVVGLNQSDNTTYVPNVVGLKYLRAVDAVHDNSLNVGKLVFSRDVRTYADSLDAVVYRQGPSASSAPIYMGSQMSLYLSLEKDKQE